MKSYETLLNHLGLDPEETRPYFYPSDRDHQYNRMEFVTPLGLKFFGFAWDETFWKLKTNNQRGLDHTDNDFWSIRWPRWQLVRTELREVTGYVPARDLLPLFQDQV